VEIEKHIADLIGLFLVFHRIFNLAVDRNELVHAKIRFWCQFERFEQTVGV
jgi:hypothetical protein